MGKLTWDELISDHQAHKEKEKHATCEFDKKMVAIKGLRVKSKEAARLVDQLEKTIEKLYADEMEVLKAESLQREFEFHKNRKEVRHGLKRNNS